MHQERSVVELNEDVELERGVGVGVGLFRCKVFGIHFNILFMKLMEVREFMHTFQSSQSL